MCALAAAACGPTTADDDIASSTSTAQTTDESASATSASPESSEGGADSSTGTSSVPACDEPSAPDIALEVTGVDDQNGSFVFLSSCIVQELGIGDVSDFVAFDCQPPRGESVALRLSFMNTVVPLPSSIAVGDIVDVAFVGAAEYGDRWLTLRHPEGRLLLGISAAAGPTIPVDGAPSDVFAPLQIESIGDRCAPGPGNCFALGEPAVLRFTLDGEMLELEPFHAGSLGELTVHAGDSWLSDPDSTYECDGPSDDRMRFIVDAP